MGGNRIGRPNFHHNGRVVTVNIMGGRAKSNFNSPEEYTLARSLRHSCGHYSNAHDRSIPASVVMDVAFAILSTIRSLRRAFFRLVEIRTFRSFIQRKTVRTEERRKNQIEIRNYINANILSNRK